MHNSIEYADIHYVPPKKILGEEEFKGIPCPTKKAYDILGEKGVQIIHQKFAEMLEWGKIRYGDEDIEKYGFLGIQHFIDLRNNILFRVGATIQGEIMGHEVTMSVCPNSSRTIPDLIIHPDLKENNYNLLKQRDHYLIKVVRKLSKSDKKKYPCLNCT